MSQTSIRLVRTPDIDKVISYLRNKYNLLSEAEIIKLALSKVYKEELKEEVGEQKVREAYSHAMEEGHKIGDRLLAERGLKREDLTEQQIYDLFLDIHKHNA